jgi:peptide/nickel transport system permease protein
MSGELNFGRIAPVHTGVVSQRRPKYGGVPWVSLLLLAVIVVMGLVGNWVVPHNPRVMNLAATFRPPAWLSRGSLTYLIGTDNMGRDILSRIIVGAHVPLVIAFYAILLSGLIGTAVGIVSGYLGGFVDALLMRLVDIQMSIPALALALLLAAVLAPGLGTVIVVISATYWTWYARIIRGEVISLKERDYIALAKVAGVGTFTIFQRHIVPNILNTLLVLATLQVGQTVIFEAGLSFLGLGVQAPDISWGLMLADGRNNVATAWWLITFPGLAIMVTCLAANVIGDWLRDTFDPRRRQA